MKTCACCACSGVAFAARGQLPNRFVSDQILTNCSALRPVEAAVNCASRTCSVRFGFPLRNGFADAQDRVESNGQGRMDLAVDEASFSPSFVTTLAVSQYDISTADVYQHGRTDFAGKSRLPFLVEICAPRATGEPLTTSQPCPGTETAGTRRGNRRSAPTPFATAAASCVAVAPLVYIFQLPTIKSLRLEVLFFLPLSPWGEGLG